MILGKCRDNYRVTARLYCVRYSDRRQHPTDIMIDRIKRRERRRPRIIRQRRRIIR